MRGLLINNYYAVRANAKVFSGFMLLLGLGSVKSDTPFFIKNLVFSGITPLLKIKKQ